MSAGDTVRFLQAFLRSPGQVGAIAPSSPQLAAAMVHGLNVATDETIVEFGPGTGPFTAAIRDILPDPACYVGIERDEQFVAILRERFPELRVVHGSAEDAPRHLAEAGRGNVRAVLCGLPFATLPGPVQDTIIGALDALLRPGAEFRTFQYVHSWPLPSAVRFRERMKAVFGAVDRSPPVVKNLPPAFVLTWRR